MKISRHLATSLKVLGFLLALVIGILIYNSTTESCQNSHLINPQGQCEYQTTNYNDCNLGDIQSVFTGESCYYAPQTMLDNPRINFYSKLLLAIALLLIIFYYYDRQTKAGLVIKKTTFDPKNFVNQDDVRKMIKFNLSKRYDIPIPYMSDKKINIKEDAFEELSYEEPFEMPNNEKFVPFDMEILEGNHTGVFTFTASQSRGKEHLVGGNFRMVRASYPTVRMHTKDKPLWQPVDETEKLIEAYKEISPELAREFQERMLEKSVVGLRSQQEQEAYQQPTQQQIPPQGTLEAPPWYATQTEKKKKIMPPPGRRK